MASNLDKVTPEKTMKALRDVTGATNEQIAQFCEGRYSPQQVLEDDELAAQLIDFAKDSKAQDAAPLATTAPSKPAKRGRKPKNTEVPTGGIQYAQSQIGAEIQAMEVQIDTHLDDFETAKAMMLASRFEAVPGNITRKLSEELGGYSSDAESFRSDLGAALASAFPLS